MKLVFHHLAKRELQEILAFYDQHSDTAGSELQDTVRNSMDNPDVWPSFHERYRRATLQRFPYQVIYRSTQDQFKIRHHKRHPRYGLGRL